MWPSSFDAASGFDVAQQFRCYTAANTNHVHGEVSQRSPQPAPNCGDARSARRSLASGWRTYWAISLLGNFIHSRRR
jgi:hypothetical protein